MRLRAATAIAALILSALGQTASAQQFSADMVARPLVGKPELAAFIVELRQLFAPFQIVPIIVPRAERVGDFYDRLTYTLLAGADDCFPKLKVRVQDGQLPSVFTSSSRGLAAALGASVAFEAEGEASSKRTYALSFRDVQVQTVSIAQLRSALPRKSLQECDVIRPILQAIASGKTVRDPTTEIFSSLNMLFPKRRVADIVLDRKPMKIPFVVGTVFMARRVLRVDLAENLDAQAKLSLSEKLIRSMGLEAAFRINAKADLGSSSSIEFIGNSVIPVAYAPAFDVTMLNVAQDDGETTLHVTEVNPDVIRANVAFAETLLGGANGFAAIIASRSTTKAFDYKTADPPLFVLGAPPPSSGAPM